MSRTYRANYFARALPGPAVRREKKLGTVVFYARSNRCAC